MCRCAPRVAGAAQQVAQPRAASSRPRSGASGRSSGVSAETFTERFTRGVGPAASRSSSGREIQRRVDGAEVVERRGAARRVAVGLRAR